MQKSIFKRYLGITMAIVILSFIMLGSVMMVFFAQYWASEKEKTLSQNAVSVANMARQAIYNRDRFEYVQDTDIVHTAVEGYAKNIDADIFITDLHGNVIYGCFTSSKLKEPGKIDQSIVDLVIQQGDYQDRTDLSGFYKSKYISVGLPVLVPDGGSESCMGVVFVTTSSSPFNAMQNQMVEIFLIAAILALAVTFCVVGFFSYSLVKPLRQMSSVVKSFGDGDFSVRMPVTSTDEVGQLSVSFNDMANSLSSSEGMRRSFIANVSHELKTPMTTIAGFIDGILDGTIPYQEQEKYLKIVSDEVKRLSRLVKSMLDLSRIDSGELRIQPQNFDISKTVFNTLLTFEPAIEEKKIEIRGLEGTGQQIVFGDQDLIHQVVYNIIENAVKFTNMGGYIAFTITDSIDRTSVAIENSGVGIEPEELPMIFDRFYKTDKSRSRDKNGMGLGLYLVRTIVKLHGGDISVSSQVNQFCRFEFYIPKRKTENNFKIKDNSSKNREAKNSDTSPINVYDADIIEVEARETDESSQADTDESK